MTKNQIREIALAGQPLNGRDVARVKHGGTGARAVYLRHRWSDNEDGRVVNALRAAYTQLANKVAARSKGSVEVYSADGSLLAETFAPSEVSTQEACQES
jgi:hypothetical protein